jgi:subtilisin family serine protease
MDNNTIPVSINLETFDRKIDTNSSLDNLISVQATTGVNPAFDLIGLTRLRNDPQFAGIDGSNFTVAVIDTGIDGDHPQLQGNFSAFVDFVYGGSNPSVITDPSRTTYTDDHGTHVAGTVGSIDPNIGVAPDVNLISLQVFQNSGGASFTDIQEALEWIYDNRNRYNIIAVNMSLGAGNFTTDRTVRDTYTILNDDINRLETAGISVVSAAGNSYDQYQAEGVAIPAILSSISTGAVWQDGRSNSSKQVTGVDRITYFSQRLDAPNTIFAPGGGIYSTIPNGRFEVLNGTSMASPHIAGAVALMQEAAVQFGGRKLSTQEVTEIMYATADIINDGDDENDTVRNTGKNYRRLNIYNAVSEIQHKFGGIGGNSGDANGTLAGAILAPTLDGSPVSPLFGSIGLDGASTNIGDKDVDIFKFDLAYSGSVTLELGSNTNSPRDFDSYLRLFDRNGTEIGNANDGGIGQFSKLTTNLNAGTYYVGVSGFSNSSYNPTQAGSGVTGATGNYTLQLSLGSNDPNGLLAGAVAVNLKTDQKGNPVKFEGFIGADLGAPVGVSDVDLFKIVVPDNGRLYIDTDTPYTTDYVDSYLRVFDAEGNELETSDDDLAFDADGNIEIFDFFAPGNFNIYDNVTGEYGHSTDSFVTGEVKRGEVYYIGISDYYNQDYDPTNLNNRLDPQSTGGQYDIYINFLNNDLNGSIPQARTDIPLPVTGQAGIIGQDGRGDGTLSDVGDRDVDFFKIRATSGGILEVQAKSNSSDPLDTIGFLFAADGTILAAANNGNSFDSLIQYRIAANTDYYAAVAGQGNNSFDPFQLGSGASGDTGRYTFNSRLRPLSDLAILSDDRASNNAVREITFDTPITANLGEDESLVVGSTDIDIYSFQALSSGKIRLQTITSDEFGADTFLRFFDSQGREIAFNDNTNPQTRGSSLTVTVTAGSSYLVGINGASTAARNYNPLTGGGAAEGSGGNYTLEVSTVLEVTGFQPTDGGFVVNFNQAFDPAQLNLYDGQDGVTNSPDLALVNQTTGATIKGSLHLSQDRRTLTFLKTGSNLTAGDYEVTLFDRADAFDLGVGNYTNQFTVSNTDDRLLSTDDLILAPNQTVDLSINLDRGEGITKVELTLTYDQNLLNVTGASLAANLPSSWQITQQDLNNATGRATITLEGSQTLTSGSKNLVNFETIATSNTDLYGSMGLIALENLELNDGSMGVGGDNSSLVIASLGDGSGNKSYSSLDAALVERVVLGLDSGFARFGLIDPLLIGDLDGDNTLSINDVRSLSQQVIGS